MELRITGRHGSMADDVKEYVEGKLSEIDRFNRHTRSVQVILDEDHLTKKVEIIAHVDHGAPVVVHANHEEARAAFDIAHDKLENALRRHKERMEDRRRGRGDANNAHPFGASSDAEDTEQE